MVVITPRTKDIGFPVRRLLPAQAQQRVGPFIFLDHMGPAVFEAGTRAGDVRPHPHIGLATVTYLVTGAMMHRDSLGSVQRIEPGAINLMTAGSGIVHSERMPEDIRAQGIAVEGLQTWLALPVEAEETAPTFVHTPAHELPLHSLDGGTLRVLIGEVAGQRSPVMTHSVTSFIDISLAPSATYQLRLPGQELAVYVVSGDVLFNETPLQTHTLGVGGDTVSLRAGNQGCRLMLLGGEPLAGVRRIRWNFVSSRAERITQAEQAWEQGRFASVPGETDSIPLPR